MYRIRNITNGRYFLSQEGRIAIWDSEGLQMEFVDAEIRVAIINKNYPEQQIEIEEVK